MKSKLGLRPVCHWIMYRICGHVAVCFLALHAECVLDYLIHKTFPEMTCTEIHHQKRSITELHRIALEKDGQTWQKESESMPFLTMLLKSLKQGVVQK